MAKANISNENKIAIIGSGPAGITCAGELAKRGYDVTIFEALHKPGGFWYMAYQNLGFLKEVVEYEIGNLEKLGVKIETDVIIGRTLTIDDLLNGEGYEAVFS